MRMKRRPWLRWVTTGIAACLGLLAAFAAGIWYSPQVMVSSPSWYSSSYFITTCPPLEGEPYDIQDFIRANNAVATYLARVSGDPENEGLSMRYVGTPAPSGYDVHYSSGHSSRGFPEKLKDDLNRIFSEAIASDDEPS